MSQGDKCPREAAMIGQRDKDQIIYVYGQDMRICSMDSLEWLQKTR